MDARKLFAQGLMALAIVSMLVPACQAQNVPLDTSIRMVDWDSVLWNDTNHFEFDSAISDFDSADFYYITSDTEQSGGVINDVVYADLNQDGKEDAIVNLFGGGSGHFASDLIFLQTSQGPKYCGDAGGPHFYDSISGDTLLVYTAHFLSMDPQCCNRAIDMQRIIGDGDTVRFLPNIVEPEEGGGWQTVYDFYEALNDSDKQTAYFMLSDSYQAQHPYPIWLKGFVHTISVDADVDKDSPDSAVRVKITSKDSLDGKIITKHYAGVWHTKFVTNNRTGDDPKDSTDWLLERPEIRRVP